MTYLLIGHRGVGKSLLLKRIKEYDPLSLCWDLDEEIVRSQGKGIDKIFEQDGEPYFRQIEKKALQQVLEKINPSQGNHYIAVGAGFEGTFPQGPCIIWVRRLTDPRGRVFRDRPQLSQTGSEYDEFLKRFKKRDQKYSQWAHFEVTLTEGLDFINPWETFIFSEKRPLPKGQLTLLPQNSRSFEKMDLFLKIYQHFFSHFEIRDDLLSEEQIQWAMDLIPSQKLLYSYRKNGRAKSNLHVDWVDWPLELGRPIDSCQIVSLHQRGPYETVESCCRKLKEYSGERHLKLAIPIKNFEELWEAHQWWSEDPENRSFLPCSKEGRWGWYRLRQKPYMKINFARLGSEGSNLDQPLLLDWLRCLNDFEKFAGVLGDPVDHSHTPIEHDTFFRARNRPVFKIKINEKELGSLHILRNLGLECAAVTSPLKVEVINYCDQLSPTAKRTQSVNTLFLGEKSIGHNTDLEGLQDLLSSISPQTAVWGGGGTRSTMSQVLPKTTPFYSARTGKLLWGNEKEIDTLIWAVGRNRHKRWPQHHPQKVVDLNYTEDSPGLEFARNTNATYISGHTMFKTQAKEQRKFWEYQESLNPHLDETQNPTRGHYER